MKRQRARTSYLQLGGRARASYKQRHSLSHKTSVRTAYILISKENWLTIQAMILYLTLFWVL
jgi:hypothetical protein